MCKGKWWLNAKDEQHVPDADAAALSPAFSEHVQNAIL